MRELTANQRAVLRRLRTHGSSSPYGDLQWLRDAESPYGPTSYLGLVGALKVLFSLRDAGLVHRVPSGESGWCLTQLGRLVVEGLTLRQARILSTLGGSGDPMTANEIGFALGFEPGEFTCGKANRGRGSTHRVMPPAQRVISSLRSLLAKGLIVSADRVSGRSGRAFVLSEPGRRALRETLK